MTEGASITRLIERASAGDQDAGADLFRSVYVELQKIARAHRRRWRGNETISTTVLINEAYLKLAGGGINTYADRSHFFATASQAMRQVLMNYAEKRSAAKRGGNALQVTLSGNLPVSDDGVEWLLTLNELLAELEQGNDRHARIVECRVFGGMTIAETADALGVSPRTVKRDWSLASAWLYREMEKLL